MAELRRPDVDRELARLRDFQRSTVDYVFDRLWAEDEPARRFLVADEVGLGKTMVARGVITKTIDHLWDSVDRIDVVYICSNAQIARQNLGRLDVGGYQRQHADRLTLLPRVISDLRGRKVNLVSFTPATSFQVDSSGGKAEERALLYWMLAKGWGRSAVSAAAWQKFFAGGAGLAGFERRLRCFDHAAIDKEIIQNFASALEAAGPAGQQSLRTELEECVASFRWLRGKPPTDVSRRRYRLIGRMRGLVARAAVDALEPDLIILDEFQRFKQLLDPDAEGAELAHALFDQPTARMLLLSATPYKMYTLPNEPEGDDHYADFVATVTFLAGAETAQAVAADLRRMRAALVAGMPGSAAGARDRVQHALRRVMCRTERLAATPDRDGMLVPLPLPGVKLTAEDVRALRSGQRLAELVDQQDIFEYWRSAPYLYNFMESYRIKDRFRRQLDRQDPALLAELPSAAGLIDWETLRSYQPLDPGNAKMRGLVADVLDRGAWQLAWLPPALPYYTPAGAYADPRLRDFTKRLVFSAWTVAPKAISVVLSYEAERRALAAAGQQRTYDDRRATGLLRFQVSEGRRTGMPVLALLYPSTTLAGLGDPLAAARTVGTGLPGDRDAVHADVRRRVAQALVAVPSGPADGPIDPRWYWAAPFLLDHAAVGEQQAAFLRRMVNWGDGDDDQQTRLVDHVRAAQAIDGGDLGRQPADLADVLATLALAGPGNCALRAMSRVCGGAPALADVEIRDSASYLSWGLRALFNRPEIMTILRGDDSADSYWRAVLDHCWDGNLQSVLDEYLHVLVESEGLQDTGGTDRADRLRLAAEAALTLRAANAVVDDIRVTDGTASRTEQRVRSHFAARFGRAQTEDQAIQRESQVRTAFNSPFWPFVLASTSVGQEGLDFHLYSHAVVHWNLPANPVDLEQREGRVHRYKGHAIRRNIATHFADAAFHATVDDPWYAMFLAATEHRPDGSTDLSPYWVYAPDGGARIERYVPAMPLSKESERYRRLQRTVGAYRLVIGQPRQDDLLQYLGSLDTDSATLRIDLTPPLGQP